MEKEKKNTRLYGKGFSSSEPVSPASCAFYEPGVSATLNSAVFALIVNCWGLKKKKKEKESILLKEFVNLMYGKEQVNK